MTTPSKLNHSASYRRKNSSSRNQLQVDAVLGDATIETETVTKISKLSSRFYKWVVGGCTIFVDDIPRDTGHETSTGRDIGRITVTLLTGISFFIFTALVIAYNLPEYRANRTWIDQDLPDPTALFDAEKTSVCPCDRSNINWPSYASFFSLTKVTQNGTIKRQGSITNAPSFCSSLPEFNGSMSCKLLVYTVVQNNISQTCMTASTLMSPKELNDTLPSRISGNLDSIKWIYDALNNSEYLKMEKMHLLWSSMVNQFARNPNSTYQDYWSAMDGKVNVTTALENTKIALGMDVNWTSYLAQCGARYCDIIVENSHSYLGLSAISQVGGYSSIIMLVVRYFVWPAFLFLLAWATKRKESM